MIRQRIGWKKHIQDDRVVLSEYVKHEVTQLTNVTCINQNQFLMICKQTERYCICDGITLLIQCENGESLIVLSHISDSL